MFSIRAFLLPAVPGREEQQRTPAHPRRILARARLHTDVRAYSEAIALILIVPRRRHAAAAVFVEGRLQTPELDRKGFAP